MSRATPTGLDDALARISRNPDDVKALKQIGQAYIDAGDPHTARLALSDIEESGGDARALYLLGEASYQAGDQQGALNAFGRAHEAGLGAATQRLAQISREIGLIAYADELEGGGSEDTRFASNRSTGSTLSGDDDVSSEPTPNQVRMQALLQPNRAPRVNLRDPRLSTESRLQLIEAQDAVAIAAAQVDDARRALSELSAYRKRLTQWLGQGGGSAIAEPFSTYMQQRIQHKKLEVQTAERRLTYVREQLAMTQTEVALRNDLSSRAIGPFEIEVESARVQLEAARKRQAEQRVRTEQAAQSAWTAFSDYVTNGGMVDAFWTLTEERDADRTRAVADRGL